MTRHSKPLRRGRALIDARTDFGPNTHVEIRRSDRVILTNVGGTLIGEGGTSWEKALVSARRFNGDLIMAEQKRSARVSG